MSTAMDSLTREERDEVGTCDRSEIGEGACTCRRCLMGQVERLREEVARESRRADESEGRVQSLLAEKFEPATAPAPGQRDGSMWPQDGAVCGQCVHYDGTCAAPDVKSAVRTPIPPTYPACLGGFVSRRAGHLAPPVCDVCGDPTNGEEALLPGESGARVAHQLCYWRQRALAAERRGP